MPALLMLICAACVTRLIGDSVCPGPDDKLNSTVISQPAIYVASLAALEKLRQTEGEVRADMHMTSLQIPPALPMRRLC